MWNSPLPKSRSKDVFLCVDRQVAQFTTHPCSLTCTRAKETNAHSNTYITHHTQSKQNRSTHTNTKQKSHQRTHERTSARRRKFLAHTCTYTHAPCMHTLQRHTHTHAQTHANMQTLTFLEIACVSFLHL